MTDRLVRSRRLPGAAWLAPAAAAAFAGSVAWAAGHPPVTAAPKPVAPAAMNDRAGQQIQVRRRAVQQLHAEIDVLQSELDGLDGVASTPHPGRSGAAPAPRRIAPGYTSGPAPAIVRPPAAPQPPAPARTTTPAVHVTTGAS